MGEAAAVRFAILGFGHHAAKRLVPAFSGCKAAVLTGAWRRNREALAGNCAEFGIAHAFGSREELCASSEVDAVFITSPDAMHKDDALLAFAHGKAVLCEKPVAMHAADAEEMARAAAEAGVVYGVAQNFRWNRTLEWMREQIAAGQIGEPQLAQAQFAYPAQKAPRVWIADPALACGGPIGDVGVHCIDALRFVLRREVETVSTVAHRDALSGEVEAVASIQMEMSGGVYATVSVSARSPYRTLVEVTGSEGWLIVENGLTVDRPVEAVIRRAGEAAERKTLDNADGYTRMLDDFARAVRGGAGFAASGTDGVTNMRVLDATYASWRSGRRESVAG
jgi:1,5-anhydro-D-fructose reductase (1,5-anhydro-D-mannitol-forming)